MHCVLVLIIAVGGGSNPMFCKPGGSFHSSWPQHRPTHKQRSSVHFDWTFEGHTAQGEHGGQQWTEDPGNAD